MAILDAATKNAIWGNLIGTDPSGQAARGNQIGVWIDAAGGNSIGGSAEVGEGNVIAFSSKDGVLVDAGAGDAIRRNSIHDSTNLGIELMNNGNNAQPAPVLTSAVTKGNLTIQGSLTAAADTTYTLDFFTSPAANPSGFGEGQTLVGSTAVTTDDKGRASFTVAFAASAPIRFVSATATAPGGSTSAFSKAIADKDVPSITSAVSTSFKVGTSGSFTVTTEGGYPLPAVITEGGTLPGGILFKDNGDGTATLSGTPDVGSGGSYSLTFTAYNNNFTEQSQQQFTLIVDEAPTIDSQDSATFTVGLPGSFIVTTTGGFPTPAKLSEGIDIGQAYQGMPTFGFTTDVIQGLLSALPSWLNFTDNGDGTATLGGTPKPGTGGVYPLTITAANQDGTASSHQPFLLTVLQVPSFDTENETTWTTGSAGRSSSRRRASRRTPR